MSCEKCWCPTELGHNIGCPDHPQALPTALDDYLRGWNRGFNPFEEDLTSSQIARLPNKSYALGCRSGQRKIYELADDAAAQNAGLFY